MKLFEKVYGLSGGSSQAFDMLVDNDGNYVMGGHTTVGDGVVNWDWLSRSIVRQSRSCGERPLGSQEDLMPGILYSGL